MNTPIMPDDYGSEYEDSYLKKKQNNMAKIRKFETQVNYLWYEAEITDEQLTEFKNFINDESGEVDEPEWVFELDFDLVKDKPGSDDYELELIED